MSLGPIGALDDVEHSFLGNFGAHAADSPPQLSAAASQDSLVASSVPSSATSQTPPHASPHLSEVAAILQKANDPTLLASYLAAEKGLTANSVGELKLLTAVFTQGLSGNALIQAVYTTATILQGLDSIQELKTAQDSCYALLKDIKRALDDRPVLSETQRSNITKTCKLLIFQPGRQSFDNDTVSKEVYENLKKNRKSNAFGTYFKEEKDDLHKSVLASKTVTPMTEGLAKVMKGKAYQVTEDDTRLVLLLRAFIREEPDAFDPASNRNSQTLKKRPRTQHSNDDEDDDDDDDEARAQADGDNEESKESLGFFDQYELWLNSKYRLWGSDSWASDAWQRQVYLCSVSSIITYELTKFPSDKIPKIKKKQPARAEASFGTGRLGNAQPFFASTHPAPSGGNGRLGGSFVSSHGISAGGLVQSQDNQREHALSGQTEASATSTSTTGTPTTPQGYTHRVGEDSGIGIALLQSGLMKADYLKGVSPSFRSGVFVTRMQHAGGTNTPIGSPGQMHIRYRSSQVSQTQGQEGASERTGTHVNEISRRNVSRLQGLLND
ncbi:hypothetical protein VKT23_006285 [Stygiomarasmius scandens]|uniref:Uncharacterized protein n=1 Tax=Marasmiellus scandens TaxID=2682957 RepID=A0ABR1JMD7_9AGAR